MRPSRSVQLPLTLAFALMTGVLLGCAQQSSPAPTPFVKPTPPTTPIQVPTFAAEGLVPPSPCPTTTLEGRLAQDERWGVAVQAEGGRVVKVVWPDGFYAQSMAVGGVQLVAPPGYVVAAMAWRVRLEGTPRGADGWLACGAIVRLDESGSPLPRLTPWPTIDPGLPFGDAVTCGDGTPSFPVEMLNGPPEGDGFEALQAFLSQPVYNPDPASTAGWRRVLVTSADALFVSTEPPGSRWLYMWLARTGAGQEVLGWYFHGSGECRPEVDFGDNVRRAELYLDPASAIDPGDDRVRLQLYELNCASGQSPAGRVLEPRLAYEPDRILVAITISRLQGPQDCQGTDPFPYTLQLTEAVGTRQLFDAARVPPKPIVVP